MAGSQACPPRLRELLKRSEARPAQRRLHDVLAQIGPRRGPISQAGTRALQEQRGEPRHIWGDLQGSLGPEFDELPDGL